MPSNLLPRVRRFNSKRKLSQSRASAEKETKRDLNSMEKVGRDKYFDGKVPGDGRKYYNCTKCRYRTDRKNNLKRHLTTMHEKCSKLLECCNLIFLNKSALKDHVSEFHAGAGYACLVCNRKFSRKALMKRHSMVHNGRREFNCHGCDYSTSHKSNLDRHVKRHRTAAQLSPPLFGHFVALFNNLLSTGTFQEDESDAMYERIQSFNELLRRDPWYGSAAYSQFLQHSNMEYVKLVRGLYNFESNLVVFKGGHDLCPLDFRRNLFVHLHGPSWNSCQICQQQTSRSFCYDNKEVQQRYLHTWMDMVRSLNAEQLVWKDKVEDVKLWPRWVPASEKDFKFMKDSSAFNFFGHSEGPKEQKCIFDSPLQETDAKGECVVQVYNGLKPYPNISRFEMQSAIMAASTSC